MRFYEKLWGWVSPFQKLNAILRRLKVMGEYLPKIECDFKKTKGAG